ncbi:nicotinate (nicotinamide) nucleotide adenylyltransferase [Solimonas marina]|uniref:Probable nicotinate-nucleotide adenylyltransferase n=1 Tax=Solimonas marina TaxID=2714601 RepID=A0A969W898_9GAMM|nr:nicotinate (nicotinamide) nucleotide adenylyltransferase [Solimonas marina]NKF21370.1 nicotinate (nicotinamide) nucleotide adenylyltransferase [Solimonas marina]
MKAIGIFGGAFAPFHNGHLRVAIEARDKLDLSQVRLIPTAHAAHRPDSRVSPQRRLEWLRVAVRREKELVPDDREILRPGISYTVDTLEELRRDFPRAALVLLMGSDAFEHFHTWNRWSRIVELAHVAVITRPGSEPRPSAETAELLVPRRAADASMLHAQPAGLWLPLEMPLLDISSTRIRRLLLQERSVRGLVPDAILNAMTTADIAALTQDNDATQH